MRFLHTSDWHVGKAIRLAIPTPIPDERVGTIQINLVGQVDASGGLSGDSDALLSGEERGESHAGEGICGDDENVEIGHN